MTKVVADLKCRFGEEQVGVGKLLFLCLPILKTNMNEVRGKVEPFWNKLKGFNPKMEININMLLFEVGISKGMLETSKDIPDTLLDFYKGPSTG